MSEPTHAAEQDNEGAARLAPLMKPACSFTRAAAFSIWTRYAVFPLNTSPMLQKLS